MPKREPLYPHVPKSKARRGGGIAMFEVARQGDEEFQSALKIIDDAITDEKQANGMYAALSQQLIDSDQRAIVEGIARDELRHYHSLRGIRTTLSGRGGL